MQIGVFLAWHFCGGDDDPCVDEIFRESPCFGVFPALSMEDAAQQLSAQITHKTEHVSWIHIPGICDDDDSFNVYMEVLPEGPEKILEELKKIHKA